MNFGFTLFFRNPPPAKVSFAELYRKEIELAVAAEELGYDTVWLTEHHFVDDGYSPSLLPIAAAIAARTKKIRIGTFVMLLPLHNALRVAEDAATVDVISNGRLDLGLGQGYRVPEFVGFNIARNERGPRLEEGTEVIRRVWTERNVTMDGRFNKLTNVTVIPGPVQKPHPPIWLAARGPKSIGRAARNGYHFMGTGGVDQQQMYDAALKEHGRLRRVAPRQGLGRCRGWRALHDELLRQMVRRGQRSSRRPGFRLQPAPDRQATPLGDRLAVR
jgi:alkanesulfonate monooxygenase SsuD/methylene tetrahydromethanopterin reductase-like flavin-dependent oxidoreductase (luciferase family)